VGVAFSAFLLFCGRALLVPAMARFFALLAMTLFLGLDLPAAK